MATRHLYIARHGDADAFGTPIVAKAVQRVTAVDFDPLFIADARDRTDPALGIEFRVADPHAFTRLAWHLGNRHVALQLGAGWLRYRLPKRFIRQGQYPLCIGQKQKWFLLQLDEKNVQHIRFDTAKPEFDRWEWVSYWYPLNQVVAFKRSVYRRALFELSPQLPLKKELLLPKTMKVYSP